MNTRRLPRASFLLAVIAAFAFGCTQTSPRTLIVGGSGDPGDGDGGSGGSDAGATTGAGVGAGLPIGAGSGGDSGTSSTGAGSSGAGGHQQQGTFDISLDDDAPSSDLKDDASLQITITPKMGFVGDVNLSASAPDGVTVDFDEASPHVSGSAKTVGITLHVSESVPVGDVAFSFTARSGTLSSDASGTLTVNPSITLHIPQNVLNLGGTPANPYRTAYGPYPMVIHAQGNMITVNFMNDDGQSHQIHSGGAFGHDPGSIPAHQMDSFVRHVPTGQYDFYLHDQGSSATPGQLIVQ